MGTIKMKDKNAEAVRTAESELLVEQQQAEIAKEVKMSEATEFADPAVRYEDEMKTDENSRLYYLNNGTAKSIINAAPVNFFDEEEKKWKRIDNTLVEEGDAFVTKAGACKTEIAKADKRRAVKISKKDKEISWTFLGKQSIAAPCALSAQSEQTPATAVLQIENNADKAKRCNLSRAVYENAEAATDLEYCVQGNGLKENIIVNEKSDEYRYMFALNSKGLKMRLSEDNTQIELYSDEKTEFTIPAPYMYDADGVTSDEVYYELDPTDDGYTFAVVASPEWINADGRAFPVTIDPQIVTSQKEIITKQTYYRNIYSNSSSGISYSGWYSTANSYIKVYKTSYTEYKTTLTVKRSLINFMVGTIASVKLILTPYGTFSGRMYVNGALSNYYYSSNGKLELDITSRFKNSVTDFTVALEPYTYNANMQFHMSATPPIIEIEYLTNENVRPMKKSFTLAGIAMGEVNLANGSMVTTICDVNPENSVMGLGIYHIHKKNADNYALGGNFRLNLNEELIKHLDADYVYTDSNGDKHGFHDYYYYINSNGVKTYITDKNAIIVDSEGKMTYVDTNNQIYSVTCEYKSTAGLKAMTTLEGVDHIEYFDQRTDDYKKIEDTFKEYEYGLKEFVRLNTSNGNIIDKFSNYELDVVGYEQFKADLANNEIILPMSDAMSYVSAKLQVQVLGYQNSSYTQEQNSIDLQLKSIANKNGLCPAELSYISDQVTAMNTQNILLGYQYSYYDDAEEDGDQKGYAKTYYTNLKNKISAQKTDIENQKKYLLNTKNKEISNQYNELNSQKNNLTVQRNNITNIKAENVAQSNHYAQQMAYIFSKKEYYLEQFQKMFIEYLKIEKQYEKMNLQLPINFLTDGKYVKGYNRDGKFVALYDRYDNYAVIEYDSYYVGTKKNSRIARVYDNTEKQILFSYNEHNQLTAITDTKGRRTCFTYNGNILTGIAYENGKNLTLSYSGNNIYSLTESKNALSACINYSYDKPTQINNYSTVEDISVNGATQCSNKLISRVLISYSPYSSYPITATTITENLVKERYYFDTIGNCTEYRKAEYDSASQQYIVTAAEQYTHNPYWIGSEKQNDPKEVVVCATRSSLNKIALDSYSFVNGDTETTIIDQFNNPIRKQTSAVLVSEWLDASGVKKQNTQTTIVDYVYDDNQMLVSETIKVTYVNPAKTVVTHKKYAYNSYGDIIRAESFVDGEEYTVGKSIEENLYDDKGNVVKTFTYNSLDASSKVYSETEYDEKGKVIAEADETGENKASYGYIDGTETVGSKILPNGSKFGYGYDSDRTATAITQSTEEGEENSTQKVYRYGEVVELKSGNDNVKYTYNHKRKIESVELNGVTDYVQYNYAENTDSIGAITKETVTATYKSGDVFVSEKDGKDNLLKLTVNNNAIIENTYDRKNLLNTSKDYISGKKYKFERDSLDNVTAVYEVDGNNIKVSGGYGETFKYNAEGKLIKKTIMGAVPQEYTYGYKSDSTNALDSITINGNTVNPKLDVLGRNAGKEIHIGTNKIAEEHISYRKVGDHATNMPSTMRFGNKHGDRYVLSDSLRYAYDNMGNIEKIYENGELVVRYQYDALSRLVREDNKVMNKTVMFAYDNNGNILKQREFAFTLKNATEIEELTASAKEYLYDGDKLLSYGDEQCAYNAYGNLTEYRGKTVAWTNRRVSSYNGVAFTYDGQGRRTAKGNITYIYDGQGRLLKQSNGLEFFYDHSGVSSLKYDGNTYFYRKDVLGNIIALLDNNGAVVVKYIYDAWGNHEVRKPDGSELADQTHIGNLNPFRCRSYYYDTETKLYFLKTRYYDSEVGRFISEDGIEYIDPDTVNGLNLYAYCLNNPVMNVDPNGTIVGLILGIIGLAALIVGTGVAIYAGVTAYNNGARGWDLVGAIAEGFLTGAVIGAIIGGLIATFIYGGPAIASFLKSTFTLGSYIMAAGELVAITLTGAQIAAAGLAALAGMGIMFARTGKSNGYWGEKWPGDHSPDHAHIKGDDGTNIRIDIDGNPLDGKMPKPQVRKAIKKLLKEIRKLFGG